jgi:predicted KAP-like P-loop ATPase
VIQNKEETEYIVDLLISEGEIIEWDVIRYTDHQENGKHRGIKTFTMSKRAYADKRNAFSQKLKDQKMDLMKKFTEIPFPSVKIN